MKNISFNNAERKGLALMAALGLLVPNGVFVYCLLWESDQVRAALANPVSLVFIVEAFFLMFLVVWLLMRSRIRRPNGWMFLAMSLLGSLAFSVPATLWLISGDRLPQGTNEIENTVAQHKARDSKKTT